MDQNIKQQIVETINGTTNVLVTVSSDPTVDELAACIGLTLVLNKLGKHATAVYSGATPSTLEFLKPDETLEDNTDSLRDFIISLDKSKADKLRYKVEDKVVKIFITPYKTSIGQKDLEFSQGDFNVDVVLAIGVHKREELDKAIVAHGRILHDASVICVNNKEISNIGVYNWQDAEASSLCEMVVDLAETIHPDNFDAQTATALLTGIVAETQRFSNDKTSPRTMSLAAKLMAAGANQQLVASKLQTNLNKSEVGLQDKKAKPAESDEEEEEPDSGTLTIPHNPSDDDAGGTKGKPSTDKASASDEDFLDEEPLEQEKPHQEKRLEPTAQSLQPPKVQLSPGPELPQPTTTVATGPAGPQITDIKSEDGKVSRPSTPAPSPKLTFEPPVMGGTLTASAQGDQPEPTTDSLSTPAQVDAPILSHTPNAVSEEVANKPLMDEETVSHIEKTVGSPHADEDITGPQQDIDALSQAAKAAAEVNDNKDQLEPLAANGSTPLDINVQDDQPTITESPVPQAPTTPLPTPLAPDPSLAPMPPAPMPPPLPPAPVPMSPAPSAGDVMGGMSQTGPSPSLSPLPPSPMAPAMPPPNLPPQVVPADPGLPPEQTASSAPQPLAPPPVPPPFLPNTPPMPPTGGQQPPYPPLPPAPGQ